MTDAQSIIDRLNSLYDKGIKSQYYTAGEKSEIEGYSWQILGKGIEKCNCRSVDRYSDTCMFCIIQIKKNLKSNDMATTSTIGAARQYHLKNGVVIEWNHKVYTHVNLTDEVAAAYLAKFPKAISRFVAVPAETATETPENAEKAVENAEKAVENAEKETENAEKTATKATKTASKSSKKSVKSEEKTTEKATETPENAE